MADLSQLARNSIALQQEMFRLADKNYGLSLRVLSQTRDIPFSTLKGWRDGSAMPAWALGELALPDEIVSIVLSPYDKQVGADAEEDADLDELAELTADFTEDYIRARNPRGPGGAQIIPIEKRRLKEKSARIAAKARRVAK